MTASSCSSVGVGRYGDGEGDDNRSHTNFFYIHDDADEHWLRRPVRCMATATPPNPACASGS
jgi:hypothetical protein